MRTTTIQGRHGLRPQFAAAGIALRRLSGARWTRAAIATLALAILALALPTLSKVPSLHGYTAVDYRMYMDATSGWLAGAPFYPTDQLAGPNPITLGDVLYPPVALWLFVPFTFLPAAMWWGVPLGLTIWAIWRLRPGPLMWPLMALCLAWPETIIKITQGNPVMWVVAAEALGMVTVGPAVFALMKPSLWPFALWGARRRRWWAFLAVFAIMCLPFGAMWADWLAAVGNSTGGGPLYSILEAPLMVIPLIAWFGRSREGVSSRSSHWTMAPHDRPLQGRA
jgi:hypothetical protein